MRVKRIRVNRQRGATKIIQFSNKLLKEMVSFNIEIKFYTFYNYVIQNSIFIKGERNVQIILEII